jgi:hypothetical protein
MHNELSLVEIFSAIIQGVIESCTDILTTSYWHHVELGKKYLKNSMSKNKMTFIF